MSAATQCFELSGLRDVTARTVRRAAKAQRLVDANRRWLLWILLLPSVPMVRKISASTNELVDQINSPESDHVPASQFKRLAHDLSDLARQQQELLEFYESVDLRRARFFRSPLENLDMAKSHLLSVIEGMRLSISPEFNDLLTEAANELHSRLNGSERRSLVGQM